MTGSASSTYLSNFDDSPSLLALHSVPRYAECKSGQIASTLTLLRWLRAFIASDCERANNPLNSYARQDGDTITREQARTLLRRLVMIAINRRAGIPDHCSGECCDDSMHPVSAYGRMSWAMERDASRVRDIRERRIRVYQFETQLFRGWFGDLLSARSES